MGMSNLREPFSAVRYPLGAARSRPIEPAPPDSLCPTTLGPRAAGRPAHDGPARPISPDPERPLLTTLQNWLERFRILRHPTQPKWDSPSPSFPAAYLARQGTAPGA